MAFWGLRSALIEQGREISPPKRRGLVEHLPIPACFLEGTLSVAGPYPSAPPAAPPPLFPGLQAAHADTAAVGAFPSSYAGPAESSTAGGAGYYPPATGPAQAQQGGAPPGPFTPAPALFKRNDGYYHNGGQAAYYAAPAGGNDTYVTVREPLLYGEPRYTPEMGWMMEREIRHQFVAKVLSLLTGTLIITGMVALAFRTVPGVQKFVGHNPWIVWISIFLGLMTIIALSCSERLTRTYPQNLLSLGLFVLCESVLVGVVTAAVDTDILLLAFAITTAVTASLILYALRTTRDFTVLSGSLFSTLVALLVVLIIGSFFHIPLLDLLVSAGAAVLFSVYIVFDIQMMTGGTHMYRLSVDEYVFATLNLYLDVINLFIYILRFLSIWRADYS